MTTIRPKPVPALPRPGRAPSRAAGAWPLAGNLLNLAPASAASPDRSLVWTPAGAAPPEWSHSPAAGPSLRVSSAGKLKVNGSELAGSPFKLTGDWTYTAFLTRLDSAANAPIFSQWDGRTSGRQIYVYFNGSNLVEVDVPWVTAVTSGGPAVTAARGPTHVAAARSGNNWGVYVDGVLVASAAAPVAQEAATTPLYLGYNQSDNVWLDALIHDAKAFPYCLTPAEIAADAADPFAGYRPAPQPAARFAGASASSPAYALASYFARRRRIG